MHRIDAKTGNPRSGEGAFLRLKNGNILYAYTHFTQGDDFDDDMPARLSAIESSDEGESWSGSRALVCPNAGEANLMCPSLLRMRGGEIGLFYLAKYYSGSAIKARILLRRSFDEGKTWTDAFCCVDDECSYVLENDRVVRLCSGRIVIPLNWHGSGEDSEFMPGVACFYYSDDDGKSWHKSPGTLQCPHPSSAGLQETGVYEADNGDLLAFSRTDLGCQYTAVSRDEGLTWSAPVPQPVFSSPLSPMCLKKIHGAAMAILNPDPHHPDSGNFASRTLGRTPLALLVSRDEFATAPDFYLLEDDLTSGYCYTAVFESEEYFLAAYYCTNGGKNPLTSSKITKIFFDELRQPARQQK